jgi:hypothetical protein
MLEISGSSHGVMMLDKRYEEVMDHGAERETGHLEKSSFKFIRLLIFNIWAVFSRQ